MASWEPVDIDRDDMGDEDYKWDDDVIKDFSGELLQGENT